jgi:hypothetical protein
MKLINKCLLVVAMLAVCLFVVPGASADEWNKKTRVTFSAPVEVGGSGAQVLPAGTYIIKIVDTTGNRDIVRITNEDETHVFTTIMSIPNYRLQSTDKTVMTFSERAQGEPEALRAWFYPGHRWGQEFVYPKSKAVAIAKAVNVPVLYTDIVSDDVEVLKNAPIEAVKPTGEVVAVAEVVETPPVVMAANRLPETASYLPLFGFVGLLSIAAAGVIRKFTA